MEKINNEILEYRDELTDDIRLSAQIEGKEVGHILLHEEFDSDNYSKEFEGKEVAEFVENLLDEYESFYTLSYLHVYRNYRGNGIAEKLLKHFVENFSDKPTVLYISSYDTDIKELMNSKILPQCYKKYGFIQLYGTGFYIRFEN